MEELLNKLIEKGWKPFDMEATRIEYRWWPEFLLRYKWRNKNWEGWNVRNLVSKESGLWQFVCENGMLNKKRWSNRVRLETSSVWNYIEIWTWEDYGWKFDSDYEYRLIESALCDEDKLEDFILDNVKVWNI